MGRGKSVMDYETIQYVKKIRALQSIILVMILVLFLVFAQSIIMGNDRSLKQTALAEVQESMQETVNNMTIHMESIRAHMEEDAMITIIDLSRRIQRGQIRSIEDVLLHMEVCEENELGQAVELIYTAQDGRISYVNAFERTEVPLDAAQVKPLYYENAAVCDIFTVDGQRIVLFIRQDNIDNLAKENIRNYIHSEEYQGNQYIWVNEIIKMEGGDNYAIRRVHPNLIESEGEYLSTSIQDAVGNYPYQTELEGIRESGFVFHSYYFKSRVDNTVQEKYSYAQYYEPFRWVVATGETLEDVYSYSEELNRRNVQEIAILMVIFLGVSVLVSGAMVTVLENQAQGFSKKMREQSKLLEEMYSTMSAGLLRMRMTEEETTLMSINPRAAQLLGVETEEMLSHSIQGHAVVTMETADAVALTQACQALTRQWESVDVECRVTWKDGSVHLLRIGNTLVDFDGEAKIIQRQFYDITEEHQQHERELMVAEERATLDPMTKIKNKCAIEEILREQIAQAAQKNRPIAVGFVDIDNFREYNNKYGHLQGDDVICYVARTLRDQIPGVVGRNGGDEFVFCVPEVDRQELEKVMQVIYTKLREGVVIRESGEKISTPCSTGIVIAQSPALDYDTVLQSSDEAMYEAKAQGKNTWYIAEWSDGHGAEN
ncbi:MAG: diguanylate cyclase [Oscillospiraceae bacterium]|nr:diguanylate cyclase [Oscillospiraceae bacterium]